MKKLLILLLFLPILSFSQEGDWFPIPGDQVSYFKKNLAIYTMKIDSIVEVDSALIYYNLRSPEFIYGTEEYSYYDPYSSWLGKYITVDEEKLTFYGSRNLNPMQIYFKRESDEPWRFVTHEDGSYYEAFIAGKEEIEIIDGLIDSVKYIQFTGYDADGNSFSGGFQDQLILSKNYGFIRVFKFDDWISYNTTMYNLYGIEVNAETYGFTNNLPEYFNSYETGYQLHFHEDDSYNTFKSEVLSKEEGDYFVEYNIEYCFEDGLFDTEALRLYPDVYPGQSILFDNDERPKGIYRIFGIDDWNGIESTLLQFYNGYTNATYNGKYVWRKEIEGGNCLIYPMYIINEYFLAMEERCPDNFCRVDYVNANEYIYGEPYDFECEVGVLGQNLNEIQIQPNPSNGMFNLSSSEKIEECRVYNTQGNLVSKHDSQINEQIIDLSKFPAGIYFLKIQLENGRLISEKIILKM